MNVKAKGRQLQRITREPNIETEIDTKNSKEISGFSFGGKLSFGIEIPIYKNLYVTFTNGYSFGLTGMRGNLRKQMKFFNCLDINISGGLVYQVNHKIKKD